MSTIKVRTNKFTMFYTADNDVIVTDLSDNTQTYCGKNSVVIVGRNVRVSFITKEFYVDILKEAVFFDYTQIIKLKKILNLTCFFRNAVSHDFASSLSDAKKVMCIEANKVMKDSFDEIIKANSEHDRIMSFMLFCKKSGIDKNIFNLILFSAIKTFCSKVIDLIESDISKRWTLRLLAEEFNLSEIAIRKKLESEGVCFRDLILEIRMKKAMSLLIEGGMSVSQISTSIGYHNTSYFISYFRSFFGITPKQLQTLLKK
ncbi:AraC family transcriptional regulator [Escherichia coli]|nr:AraC family transcriptional regulator [Escherichia coli]EFA5076157.1 AraC family transcriptional regulator [Escherichia coli]HEI2924353.1 helix-turn-helix transcriptional regulator [Escherichia coli]